MQSTSILREYEREDRKEGRLAEVPEGPPVERPAESPVEQVVVADRGWVEQVAWLGLSESKILFFSRKEMEIPTDSAKVYLLIGKPKSGKSFLARYILQQGFRSHYFKFGYVFSETDELNHDYSAFFPKKRIHRYSENALKNYVDKLRNVAVEYERKEEKIPPSVLVVDDAIGKVNFWSETWTNLISIRRHLNLSIIIISQSLFAGGYGSSTLLRDCVDYAFLWNTNTLKSIEGYFKSFGARVFRESDSFQSMYEEAVSVKHRCLMFRNTEQRADMFGMYLAPAKYETKKIEGF